MVVTSEKQNIIEVFYVFFTLLRFFYCMAIAKVSIVYCHHRVLYCISIIIVFWLQISFFQVLSLFVVIFCLGFFFVTLPSILL
jgi:hypothetical protein